jgi:hypothetical protein
VTLSPGAGHGEEGDASSQGPAQEADRTQIETLPVSPKPTNTNNSTNTNTPTYGGKPPYSGATDDGEAVVAGDVAAGTAADLPNAVIALEPRTKGPATGGGAALASRVSELVTVRAKPEKRKNARERARERNERRNGERNTQSIADKPGAAEDPGASAIAIAGAPVVAHPKPEKRKNAKERAKEKFAKAKTADGITPDLTAKAKSKVGAKVGTKIGTKMNSAKSQWHKSKMAETKKGKKTKAA